MPAAYESMRDAFARSMSEKAAKKKAARIYIAKGKGGTRSSRAKSLRHGKYDAAAKAIAKRYRSSK